MLYFYCSLELKIVYKFFVKFLSCNPEKIDLDCLCKLLLGNFVKRGRAFHISTHYMCMGQMMT